MKHILITIAAILLVGCGESQQSVPPAQTQPAEPVSEAPAQPSPQAEEATSTTDNWDGKQKWEIKTSSGKIPEGWEPFAYDGNDEIDPFLLRRRTSGNWDGNQKWEIKTSSVKITEGWEQDRLPMIAMTSLIRSSFAVALLATGMAIKSGR